MKVQKLGIPTPLTNVMSHSSHPSGGQPAPWGQHIPPLKFNIDTPTSYKSEAGDTFDQSQSINLAKL